jgi:apolipoprotein N-acyltransferase
MLRYGDMPPMAPTLLLIGYSMVLGLYFGLFGLGVLLVRKATGSTRLALAAAPILWAALELAAARITSVPWDQLGYSQVDNGIVNQLAPWTGVYGISFVLVVVNAFYAQVFVFSLTRVTPGQSQWNLKPFGGYAKTWFVLGSCLIGIVGGGGILVSPPKPAVTATAVLIQPNLDVGQDNRWDGPGEWDRHMAEFKRLAGENCKTYIAGIPQTGAPHGEIVCPPYPTHPDLVVWPESPAPFFEPDPRFQRDMAEISREEHSPLVVNAVGAAIAPGEVEQRDYVSAVIYAADGNELGRYDKIHLVPFGEYIPFQNLLTFAHKLTGRVAAYTRGDSHKVFILSSQNGQRHRYGVFICYEAVFADEVREFSQLGAEVLVNISDDGWYGDTSAPWQHLNMLRMRAIENRRWILRDTNNGVTASIDPYGRVRQSIPRHAVDALPAEYGFRSDVTFYTAHGDLFAWLCVFSALVIVAWSGRKLLGA